MLAGCAPSAPPETIERASSGASEFRYALNLNSTADLDRAFAAGRNIDTLGLALNEAVVPEYRNELNGARECVELLKKTNGETAVHLLLSRGKSQEQERKVFGELFLVMTNKEGRAVSSVLLDQFECSSHVARTLSLGWFERAVFCHSETQVKSDPGWYERTKGDGMHYATVTFQYDTARAWLEQNGIRTSRDVAATSTVLEGESALVPMCSFNQR